MPLFSFFFPLQALCRQLSIKMLYRICYEDKFWLTRYLTHNGENRTNGTTLVVCTPPLYFRLFSILRVDGFVLQPTKREKDFQSGEKKNTNKYFTWFYCTNTSFFYVNFLNRGKLRGNGTFIKTTKGSFFQILLYTVFKGVLYRKIKNINRRVSTRLFIIDKSFSYFVANFKVSLYKKKETKI